MDIVVSNDIRVKEIRPRLGANIMTLPKIIPGEDLHILGLIPQDLKPSLFPEIHRLDRPHPVLAVAGHVGVEPRAYTRHVSFWTEGGTIGGVGGVAQCFSTLTPSLPTH